MRLHEGKVGVVAPCSSLHAGFSRAVGEVAE